MPDQRPETLVARQKQPRQPADRAAGMSSSASATRRAGGERDQPDRHLYGEDGARTAAGRTLLCSRSSMMS